jgi:hypothetical protein
VTVGPDRQKLTLAAFVVLFLAFQLLVPAAALFSRRPAPFGWQMYSALPQLPQAWLVDTAGHETQVNLGALFAESRAEIDYAAALRMGLCDLPGAKSVKLLEPDARAPEIIECP